MAGKTKGDRTCANCAYFEAWKKSTSPQRGDCRRFPPSLHDEEFLPWRFPILWSVAYCGEFKRRGKPDIFEMTYEKVEGEEL